MFDGVQIKTYERLPDFDKKEILRYAGYKGEADEVAAKLLDECLQECKGCFSYRVAYIVRPIEFFWETFGESKTAHAHLDGCKEVALFAATVGLDIDRLVSKYAYVSTVKALFFQAIGAERIEALCEEFCKGFGGKRFSAGYGDFPLEKQTEFFRLLDCSRKIGLTLNDSLLMSPTKSVTAAVGVCKNVDRRGSELDCSACLYKHCEFKK